MLNMNFETKEEGIEELKEGVKLRNQMGGALYWNIINDDCVRMAENLLDMGVPKAELEAILNS